jgi:hypothetical protein
MEDGDGQSQARQSTQRPTDLAALVGNILRLFAIVTVLSEVAGYVVLARYRLLSVLLSLGTIAIAIYIQRTLRPVMSALAVGRLKAYRKPLLFVPLVTGMVILGTAIVLIAVIWGYSLREVVDGMLALRNGVYFGDIRISAGDIFTFAGVFTLGHLATRWLEQHLKGSIISEFVENGSARSAIISGIGYIGIVLAAAFALTATGLDLTQLAFLAGALVRRARLRPAIGGREFHQRHRPVDRAPDKGGRLDRSRRIFGHRKEDCGSLDPDRDLRQAPHHHPAFEIDNREREESQFRQPDRAHHHPGGDRLFVGSRQGRPGAAHGGRSQPQCPFPSRTDRRPVGIRRQFDQSSPDVLHCRRDQGAGDPAGAQFRRCPVVSRGGERDSLPQRTLHIQGKLKEAD